MKEARWPEPFLRGAVPAPINLKSKFSVSDGAFRGWWNQTKRTPCINIVVRNWCDCGWVKLIFFFINIFSKFSAMFLISSLNRT